MIQTFLDKYTNTVSRTICDLSVDAFQKAVDILTQAYRDDKQIFIAGNGGSAGTANHFSCDFGKNAVLEAGKRRFRILSLSDNVEKITAYGNDIAFEEIFSQQMENLMNPHDVLILVSASGNSPDLVRACEYAKSKDAEIIALTGFQGGAISQYADANFIVPLTHYGQIEDIHMLLLHIIVSYFQTHPEVLTGAA